MKPIKTGISIITLACCAFSALPAFADAPFTGLNLGVGFLANQTNFKSNWNATQVAGSTIHFNGSQSGAPFNPAGNVFILYGIQIGHSGYIAPELEYVTNTRTSTTYGTPQTDGFDSTYNYMSQASLNTQINASVRLGYYLSNNNDLVYVRPGIAYAQLNTTQQVYLVSNPANATQYPTENKNLMGGQIGLGYAHFFQNFGLQFEADYLKYQSTQVAASTTTGSSSSTTYQPSQLRFGVAAVFKF
jgi:hypothetical protein